MKSNHRCTLGVIPVVFVAALSGCGGGSGGSGSAGAGPGTGSAGAPATTTVSGIVSAGLARGATVTATCGTGATPIGSSSAPTDSNGNYTINLTQDCVGLPVLLTARPSAGGMSVADEFLGAPDNGGSVPTVAAGAAWTLRTYYTLNAGQANIDVNITPLSDMAVELADAVRSGQNRFAGGASLSAQPTYPLSTALVASANAVVRVMVLGDDPSALAANPASPATVNTADAGQVQLAVVLASLSLWASNAAIAPTSPWHLSAATTADCLDPLICGATASPLAALEAALVEDLGNHLVMTDYDPDAQGNPRYLTYNRLSADPAATAATSRLPANALQGVALTIETGTRATGPTTVTPTVAQASASLVSGGPGGPSASVSSLLASSWIYIQNGYVAPGF